MGFLKGSMYFLIYFVLFRKNYALVKSFGSYHSYRLLGTRFFDCYQPIKWPISVVISTITILQTGSAANYKARM